MVEILTDYHNSPSPDEVERKKKKTTYSIIHLLIKNIFLTDLIERREGC